MFYIECSAKNCNNVNEAFMGVATRIMDKIDNEEIDPNEEFGIKVGEKRENQQTKPQKTKNSLTRLSKNKETNTGGKGCC